MVGLTPTQQEVLASELLSKQILEAQFPDLDLREGTGLRDLTIRPAAFLMSLVKKTMDTFFYQNTIAGATDDTQEDIINAIMSNWFVPRHSGTFSVISARLFFARPKSVTLSSNTWFSPDNTLKYFPPSTTTFSSSSLAYDSYTNEWYCDVFLQAESSGSEYNIGAGSLLYFSNFDPYFLRAEINYLVAQSIDAESNLKYIDRARFSISTRNLVNNPSIIYNVQAVFPSLARCTPIGFGDLDMIRDQIKVVVESEEPRIASGVTYNVSSTEATVVLPSHGFEIGQIITITGANPLEYNGTWQITNKSSDTFSFKIPGSPLPAFTQPFVQSFNAPVLVHNGGMVDTYCDSTVGSSIVQLLTDDNGVAELPGPVYDFSRSLVTGGPDDDSIPIEEVYAGVRTFNTSTKVLQVTLANHGLVNGNTVTVFGATQSKVVTSINCANLLVTCVCPNHGLTTGRQVTVTNVAPSSYTGTFTITVLDINTFTYPVPANILQPGVKSPSYVANMYITNPEMDGNYPISYVSSNVFTITLTKAWASVALGQLVSPYLKIYRTTPFTIVKPNLFTKAIDSMSVVGTTATITMANHGYHVNRYITVRGSTNDNYNGLYKIVRVTGVNTFEAELKAFSRDILDQRTPIAPPPPPLPPDPNNPVGVTGYLYCTATIPWQDTGFSTRQKLLINFGANYANQTASFETQHFTNLDGVQGYFESADTHILCGDYLARGYNLCVLDVSVTVYNGIAPSTGQVQEAVNKYLDLLPAGDIFVLSDMAAIITDSGINNLQTPIKVNYTLYNRDLVNPEIGVIADVFDPVDDTNVYILRNVDVNSMTV